MKCKILHESAGRIRVHLNCRRMTLHQADVLEYYLRNVDGVREVSVFDRTQDAVIVYPRGPRRARARARGVLVRQGRNNGPCPRPYDAQTQP